MPFVFRSQARIWEAEQAAANVEDPSKMLDLAEAYGVLLLGDLWWPLMTFGRLGFVLSDVLEVAFC